MTGKDYVLKYSFQIQTKSQSWSEKVFSVVYGKPVFLKLQNYDLIEN